MASNKNQKINQNATTSKESQEIVDSDEIDDGPQNIYEKIYDIAGKAASTNLGQYAIEKVDRILTIVEKTAKWSLPQKESEADKGISAPVLERPCSWIPFLTLIVALRVVRVGLSFGSIIIGNRPVSPSNMVHFIQSRRRKLRAIKYHGLRAIRMKKQSQDDRKRRGVIGKLTSIFNMVVCRPGITTEPETHIIVKDPVHKSKKFKTNENHVTLFRGTLNSNETASQKRPLERDNDAENDNSESDSNLSVDKLLDKYGNKGSDIDDPDFEPEMKSEDSLSTESELSDNEELIQKLNELKRRTEMFKIVQKDEAAKITSDEINDVENDNKIEDKNDLKSEKLIESDNNEKTTSVTVNPTRMSPKIAQNGTIDDEKYENFYDTLECGSDDTEQKKGGSSKFSENNITMNDNMNVKKLIDIRENCSIHNENTTTDNTSNNENLNENHVQQQQQHHLHHHQQHHHNHQTNNNQTKQHNNKKFYNNSNHNTTSTSTTTTTFKYNKGRKIH